MEWAMLVSEMRGWQWAITWDNARPANSSKMIKALAVLGKVTKVHTKTTVLLAPKKGVGWQRIRGAIGANLHPAKGNALYANLQSHRAFHLGPGTKGTWKRVK
jgi:hypothetical protein